MKATDQITFSTLILVSLVASFVFMDRSLAASHSEELRISRDARTEIALIAKKTKPAFRQIKQMRDKNNTRLIELTEIPAPPFKEEKRGEEFAKRLRALGLTDVVTDEVGNVIATKKGTEGKRTIAIVAHLDTVFPLVKNLKVKQEGTLYSAPGVGDNTRGLVVLLSLVEVMQSQNIQTRDNIQFIGSVGEEGLGDLRGVRHLFREGAPPIDAMIAIDGGLMSRLVTSAVGSNRYRVLFSGPGGHSYSAFGRVHPHQALATAISEFTRRGEAIIAQGGEKATFSVGRLGGGTSINSIPFNSWMEVDMRSTDAARLEALDAAFKASVQFALDSENQRRTEGDPLSVEIESLGVRPAGSTATEEPFVQRAAAALDYLGVDPVYSASSTDANIPMSLNIPAITISRGGISRNAHAPSESWEDKESHLAIQAALLILLAEAGLVME